MEQYYEPIITIKLSIVGYPGTIQIETHAIGTDCLHWQSFTSLSTVHHHGKHTLLVNINVYYSILSFLFSSGIKTTETSTRWLESRDEASYGGKRRRKRQPISTVPWIPYTFCVPNSFKTTGYNFEALLIAELCALSPRGRSFFHA